MLRLVSVSIFALSVALGAPAISATDATLPGPVSTSLGNATSAADIAALVLANSDLAATIMAEAAALGIASPAQVLSEAISPSSSSEMISTLVCAAAEAAPGQADLSAAAAFPLPVAHPGAATSLRSSPRLQSIVSRRPAQARKQSPRKRPRSSRSCRRWPARVPGTRLRKPPLTRPTRRMIPRPACRPQRSRSRSMMRCWKRIRITERRTSSRTRRLP